MGSLVVAPAVVEAILVAYAEDPRVHREVGVERTGLSGREDGIGRVADPGEIGFERERRPGRRASQPPRRA